MRNEQICLDGRELWESLRWWYDRNHNQPMVNFDPLNCSVIGFSKVIDGKEVFVSLKEALMSLDDPFTYNPKTAKFTEKTPQKLSYLIFGQFIWRDRSPIEIWDLELQLFYDEECKHPVIWVTFQFPKKHLVNGSSFAVKCSIVRNPEFLAYNVLMENNQIMTDITKKVEAYPRWQETIAALSKEKREQWKKLGKDLINNRMFTPRICGLASESR